MVAQLCSELPFPEPLLTSTNTNTGILVLGNTHFKGNRVGNLLPLSFIYTNIPKVDKAENLKNLFNVLFRDSASDLLINK